MIGISMTRIRITIFVKILILDGILTPRSKLDGYSGLMLIYIKVMAFTKEDMEGKKKRLTADFVY
jgi:hypothetical protein